MSQLIKDIAQQCNTVLYGVENGFDSTVFDKEKFAELIVKECVDYAFYHGDDIEYVKKHFGVKE